MKKYTFKATYFSKEEQTSMTRNMIVFAECFAQAEREALSQLKHEVNSLISVRKLERIKTNRFKDFMDSLIWSYKCLKANKEESKYEWKSIAVKKVKKDSLIKINGSEGTVLSKRKLSRGGNCDHLGFHGGNSQDHYEINFKKRDGQTETKKFSGDKKNSPQKD